jgi:hypothetical protein
MPITRRLLEALKPIRRNAFLIGLASLIWFMLRTGRKPSRASYPCQQVAASNGQVWLATYLIPTYWTAKNRVPTLSGRAKLAIAASLLLLASSALLYGTWSPRRAPEDDGDDSKSALELTGWEASSKPDSNIFVLSGTSGGDGSFEVLLDLMGAHGLPFYRSEAEGKNAGPAGLISANDVVLVKVNCQWDERGGTNTDLLREIIQSITEHPDGFTGEVVVADNGQHQYGSSGEGGSFRWERNNAEDRGQSVQRVVDSFDSFRVSCYLWDEITDTRVEEYSSGDARDGFVVEEARDPETGAMVSYPKFRTAYGTYVSFREGVWDPEAEAYDVEGLKVINVPVLKSHSIYGVTACVKHYMGVPSEELTSDLGSSTHDSVGRGGMGTLMAATRFPALNVLDAIWVNANPRGSSGAGPSTPYEDSTSIGVIAASTDPFALDRWAAEHVLMEAAPEGVSKTSMDPDSEAAGSFGKWLSLSMAEILRAGRWATTDEAHMNVYVENLQP